MRCPYPSNPAFQYPLQWPILFVTSEMIDTHNLKSVMRQIDKRLKRRVDAFGIFEVFGKDIDVRPLR